MKPLSILFYIEPVVYRNDPLMLLPCIEWIASIIRIQSPNQGLRFSFASNRLFCRAIEERLGFNVCERFEVDSPQLLEPFSFDRNAYGRDLYGREGHAETNSPLVAFLKKVSEQCSPNVVITFSQNRYITSTFADQLTLFWEMGPLPRFGGGQTFSIDPLGHQNTNILNSQLHRVWAMPVPEATLRDALECWDRLVMTPVVRHPQADHIREWLWETSHGRPVVLFAMQPPDWLTYEGAYDVIYPDNLLMRWLSELPDNWMAVPTHHSNFRTPGLIASERALTQSYDALTPLPDSLSALGFETSEVILPHVHAVSVISSAVGMTGLLHGKNVVAHGLSHLTRLSGSDLGSIRATASRHDMPTLTAEQRAKLIIFLTSFYCHSHADILRKPDYFISVIRRMIDAKNPLDPYFDFQLWSASRIEHLLTGA